MLVFTLSAAWVGASLILSFVAVLIGGTLDLVKIIMIQHMILYFRTFFFQLGA